MADTEEEGIVRVFAWPRGTPLPANYVDGMAGMIEGDDDFEYDPNFKFNLPAPETEGA